jgi:hypothetical protein
MDLLLEASTDLVHSLGAELDHVEGVQHGDGVLELVVDGVLVAVKRVQGRDRDVVAEGLAACGEPVGVDLSRPAGDQVQQPGANTSLLVTGQVDHPRQLLRAAATGLDGLGRDVVPHMLIDAQTGHFSKRVSSAAIASSSGLIERHTVRHVVPIWRAMPATLACSRRSRLRAHQHARVSSARRQASPRGPR